MCSFFNKNLFMIAVFLAFTLAVGPSQNSHAKKKKSKDEQSTQEPTQKNVEAGSNTIGISPPVFDLSCNPGEKKTVSIKVENSTRFTTAFSLYPIGLKPVGSVDLLSRPISSLPENDLSRHVIVESPDIVVPPRSYKNVSVTINVPDGLTGTQYVGLTAVNASDVVYREEKKLGDITRKSEFEMEISMGIQPAIGITIKCHMEGTLKYGYALQGVTTISPKGNEPLMIVAKIKNTGNAEMDVLPMLILTDQKNQVVARMKADRRVSLFPASVTSVNFSSLFTTIPPGSYKSILSMAEAKYSLPPSEGRIVVP